MDQSEEPPESDVERKLRYRHTDQSFFTRRRLALDAHHSASAQPSVYLAPHLRPGAELSNAQEASTAAGSIVVRQPHGPPRQAEAEVASAEQWRRRAPPPHSQALEECIAEQYQQAIQQQQRREAAASVDPNHVITPRSATTPTTPMPVRSAPRASYIAATSEAPSRHTLSSNSEALPLPLLIVGLNRTLLCRKIPFTQDRPSLRPYLAAMLAYVFGLPAASDAHEQLDQWARFPRRRNPTSPALPHGTDYWPYVSSTEDEQEREVQMEPTPAPTAPYRALLWSNAATGNIRSMARKALTTEQMQHLLRVWGRDTLVPARYMKQEAVSTKGLEIVWEALNADGKLDSEGEKRVIAEYRKIRDSPTGVLVERLADVTISSSEETTEGTAEGEVGERESNKAAFGQHNTLLLDDEPAVCRLQPYNVLMVTEYTPERATIVTTWRQSVEEAKAQDQPAPPPPSGMDDVLLQTVGVLSHARWQRNVSTWIRSGGLGFFSGIRHPGMQGLVEPQNSEDGVEDDSTEPRLEWPNEKRMQSFWVQEGRKALRAAGIACEIG